MQQSGQQRISKHRNRPEHGYAGDRVRYILVMGIGDRVGGDDRRGAADRGTGGNELRQLAVHAKQLAHPDRKGEGCDQRCGNDSNIAAADLDHLRDRQLQSEQDDGDAQHAAG